MMNCSVEIDIFYPNAIGGFTGAGSVTETFSAESYGEAYIEFVALLKKLRSKRHPEPHCFKGKLFADGHEILSVDECVMAQRTSYTKAQAVVEKAPEDHQAPPQNTDGVVET